MNVEPGISHYLSTYEALGPRLAGADLDWLQTVRAKALSEFQSLGFPQPNNEDWKYTRTTPIQKHSFEPCVVTDGLVDNAQVSERLVPGLDAHLMVFVNGHYSPELSRLDIAVAGAMVCPLDEALSKTPERVSAHLGRHAPSGTSGFSALNTAFINDGAYIQLEPGVVLDKPIVLMFVSALGERELMSQPRVLVVAERGARATVIEQYVSLDEAVYFNNAVTEIVLSDSAEIEHYKLQSESHKAFHVATMEVTQADQSRFVSHSVSLGGQLARNDINSRLGAGAYCELNGLYMATGRQHMDFHTRVDHEQPDAVSKEFYKGVLDGRARGVFNGRVYVHEDAQRTDAEQANKNLLLSRDAEIDTKPQLEIYADDVKCAHGATVGQLDENMVFYLRSRGIKEAAARGLLTYGFASDVVERMGLEPIRESLSEQLIEWLPNSAQVRELVK